MIFRELYLYTWVCVCALYLNRFTWMNNYGLGCVCTLWTRFDRMILRGMVNKSFCIYFGSLFYLSFALNSAIHSIGNSFWIKIDEIRQNKHWNWRKNKNKTKINAHTLTNITTRRWQQRNHKILNRIRQTTHTIVPTIKIKKISRSNWFRFRRSQNWDTLE